MARDQQQVAGRDDLVLGQLIAGLLGSDQRRDQIVAGSRAALLDQVAQILAQPQPGLQPLVEAVGRSPVKVMNGSSACASSAEARLNCGSSSIGTPSSRQITATGSG